MRPLIFMFLCIFSLAGGLSSCSAEDENPTSGEEEEKTSAAAFSVMSFNIRNDANPNDPQSLDERKSNILSVISENDPDIVGLQEFSNDWFEEWMVEQMSSLGYDSYYDPQAGRGSPKAIFYKDDRFERKDQATFEMFFTEGRTGTWVILHDNRNDQDYFISNSHWTTASSADRVKSANKVISEIKTHYKGLPMVIFGDFNAKPGSPEIDIIDNASFLELTNVDADNENTFNAWQTTGRSKLDWIFYSENSLELVDQEVIRTSFDGFWPSDHWPIMASFNLPE